MSERPPPSRPKSSAEDIDLYCLECGYNLRGLSGDPRRCPECGHLNPMGDLELPAELVSAQLRKMETEPALCVGFALLAGISLALLTFLLIEGRNVAPGAFLLAIPLLVSMALWYSSARKFRESCLNKPGWADALWRYHLYGLGLSLLVAGLVLLPMILRDLRVFSWPGLRGSGGPLITYVSFVGAGVVIVILGRGAHRRLLAILAPLQREVAVILARDVLRKRLRSIRCW